MSQPTKIEKATWDDVESFIKRVSNFYRLRINGKNILTGVYGIPRGGLVLAVMISHRLDIPLLMAPCEGCLVVDDISDTGVTLKHYKNSGYHIATMHIRENTSVIPEVWHKISDGWVEYPWEGKE